mmetsp:Transcript_1088/g.1970  ORF Transcript_1088/g.1970 Transcript_1088/m.1970 type:complete len:211 (+) Transcript_1088:97-729(+)
MLLTPTQLPVRAGSLLRLNVQLWTQSLKTSRHPSPLSPLQHSSYSDSKDRRSLAAALPSPSLSCLSRARASEGALVLECAEPATAVALTLWRRIPPHLERLGLAQQGRRHGPPTGTGTGGPGRRLEARLRQRRRDGTCAGPRGELGPADTGPAGQASAGLQVGVWGREGGGVAEGGGEGARGRRGVSAADKLELNGGGVDAATAQHVLQP